MTLLFCFIVESEPAKAESVGWDASSVDWSAPVSKPVEDEFVLSWDDDDKG